MSVFWVIDYCSIDRCVVWYNFQIINCGFECEIVVADQIYRSYKTVSKSVISLTIKDGWGGIPTLFFFFCSAEVWMFSGIFSVISGSNTSSFRVWRICCLRKIVLFFSSVWEIWYKSYFFFGKIVVGWFRM